MILELQYPFWNCGVRILASRKAMKMLYVFVMNMSLEEDDKVF